MVSQFQKALEAKAMKNSWGKPYSKRAPKQPAINVLLFKGKLGWTWRLMRGTEMLATGIAPRQCEARVAIREAKKSWKGKL